MIQAWVPRLEHTNIKNRFSKKFLRSAHATNPTIGRRSRKFWRKFFEKNPFGKIFGRLGAFRKSRATRRQNPSLLRCLATHKTSKKQFRKYLIFFGLGNPFFVIFPGFWRSWTILDVKITFLVKFCSRCTYPEVRSTKIEPGRQCSNRNSRSERTKCHRNWSPVELLCNLNCLLS